MGLFLERASNNHSGVSRPLHNGIKHLSESLRLSDVDATIWQVQDSLIRPQRPNMLIL